MALRFQWRAVVPDAPRALWGVLVEHSTRATLELRHRGCFDRLQFVTRWNPELPVDAPPTARTCKHCGGIVP